MIILATVSINAVFGERGLIKRAEQAKQKSDEAQNNENEELKLAEKYIDTELNKNKNKNEEMKMERNEIEKALKTIKDEGKQITVENLQSVLGSNVKVVYCDDSGNEKTASVDIKYASLNLDTKLANTQVIEAKYVKIIYINSGNWHVINLKTGKISFSCDENGEQFTHENTGKKGEIEDTTIEYKGVKLKVGDYVEYTPDMKTTTYNYEGQEFEYEGNFKWRVLGINEDGKLELISENPTKAKISPKNYNNWVFSINDMCNTLYKNDNIGTTARNLNMEDIKKKMDLVFYDYHNFTDRTSGYRYGEREKIEETKENKIPSMFALEKNQKVNGVEGKLGLSEQKEKIESTSYIDSSAEIEATQTYWSELFDTSDYFVNPIYYDLFMTKGERSLCIV